MTNKTGWVTEADIIVGYDKLSDVQKAYRQSQKVWLNPELEPVRQAAQEAGITYIVSIAGYEYKFYCALDAWCFTPVRDRAYCGYDYFIDEIESGRVWESGDVEAWKEVHKR